MQSFAAEAGSIEQSAAEQQGADETTEEGENASETVKGSGESGESGSEGTDANGSSGDVSGSQQGDSQTDGQTSDQSDSDKEGGQDSSTEQNNGTNGSGNSDNSGQSNADTNNNGSSDSNQETVTEEQSSEDAVNEVDQTSEETVTIGATQFGTKSNVLSDENVTKYKNLIGTLEAAMKNSNSDVNLEESSNYNDEVVNQAIAYILEQDFASENAQLGKVLPSVTYQLDSVKHVTKVTFSYAKDKASLKASAATWSADGVSLTYGVTTGSFDSLKLKRISLNKDGSYNWDNSTDVSVEANTNGTYTDKPHPGDYAYVLYGYEDNKVTTYSNIVKVPYTLPSVTDLKVSAVDRTGTTFTWDKLDVADGYILSRDESVLTTITDKNTTSFKDETAPADGNFTYEVKAYRQRPGEDSRWESAVTVNAASAKTSALSKPSISFVSPSSDQATLNWSGNAEGYELYKVNNGSYEKVTEVSGTSYQLNGLEVGQTYSYAVCPFKTSDGFRVYGEMSDTVNVTTSLSGSSIQASAAAYNQINLAWAQTAQADGYEIYRNGQLLQTVWGGNNCSYADTAIACGTTYTYQVRPFKNANGTTSYGAFSGEASAVTSLPGTSMQGVDSQEYQVLTVSWNQGEGATGYELYRSNTSGTGYNYLADITDGNTTSYRDTAVTVGETWFYKVKPYRMENGQKVYGSESGEVSGLVTLGSVSGVNAWASAYNRIELTWNKLSYATGYEIYYSTSPDSGYQFLKKVGKNTTKFRWSKAVCGTTYYFQVRPIQKVKKVTNYGTFSNAVSAMTTIGQPSPTVNKVTYDSLTLKWKAVKGAKGYNIYVSDSADGSYQYYMTTKRTSNVLKKLDAGRTYYFKVTAFRDNYESPLSGNVSGRPSIGNVTKLKVVSQSGTELKVSWSTVKGAEKYVILRSDSQNGNYTQIGETNKAYYVDGGLANSTTYFYKVYAVRGNCSTDQAGPVNARTKDAGSVNTDEDKKSIYKGIDVSSYQGDINWEAVASDGIDFAMIRIVTGKNASAVNYDSKFKTNYSGARAAGLNVGVYRYSYATSRTLARKEAKAVIEALDGRKLDYPIVMDFEDSSILQSTSTNARRSEIILAFKEEIENAGYKFALYANKNWLENYIDVSMLGDTHIWIARWRSLESGHGYSGKGTVTMWQYSDSGSVKGISGKVDMDVSYKKYRN